MTTHTNGTSTIESRFDLYRNVHKGIRRSLARLIEAAGALDPSSGPEVTALEQHLRSVARVIEAHHRHEDTFVGPHLERAAPPLFADMERDHVALAHDLDRLLASAANLADDPADRARRAHGFYLDLAGYVGRYFAHLDQEERAFNVALQSTYGDAELVAIERAIVEAIAPDLKAEFLTHMLPALGPAERDDLFAELALGAPEPVLNGLLDLAGLVLPPREAGRLRTSLGRSRAPDARRDSTTSR